MKTITIIAALTLVLFFAFAVAAEAKEIPCTEAALHAEIARINSQCGSLSQAEKTITFNCSPGTVIKLSEAIGDRSRDEDCDNPGSSWDKGTAGCSSCAPTSVDPNGCTLPSYDFQKTRILTCAGTVIDGENKVTFELAPGCDDRLVRSGKPNGCTEVEGHDFLFRVNAANMVIKNLTYKYFWEGIQATHNGRNLLLDSVKGIRSCDDAFSSFVPETAGPTYNITIQNSVFKDGCDKCVQLNGQEASSTLYPNYDVKLLNNSFQGCLTPVMTADGRYYIEGNTFTATASEDTGRCFGPVFAHSTKPNTDPIVYWKNNIVGGSSEALSCKRGLKVEAKATLISLGGNVFKNGKHRGAWVINNGKALFQCDTFQNNGGAPTGEGGVAGLWAADNAQVVVGTGSLVADKSASGPLTWTGQGKNTFIGNGCVDDDLCDIYSQSVNTVMAINNWWGVNANPDNKIEGPGAVTFTPWLTAVPNCQAPGGPVCGNGIIEAGEQCDGSNLAGATCTSLGYTGGALSCTSSCTYATVACTACVDNDGDGYGAGCTLGPDCNDANQNIHPNTQEICTDSVDNNCNQQTDCSDTACSTNSACGQDDRGDDETSGLVAYYPFDANANDTSGNGRNGAATATSFVAGVKNNAVQFNGTSSFITIQHHSSIDFVANEDFTMAFWFKDQTTSTDVDNGVEFFEKQLSSESAFYQMRSPNVNSALKGQADDGPNQDTFFSTTGNLADGAWHHVAFVRQYGSFIKGYVDGVEAGSDTLPAAGSLSNTANLILGKGSNGFYDGALDELRIYSRAMTPSEIQSIIDADKATPGSGNDDTTSPTISNITTGSINKTAATIMWNTNEAADSEVQYGTTTEYGAAAANTATVLAHAVALSNLLPDTTYHYRVRSTDASANASTWSADKTFATDADAQSQNLCGNGIIDTGEECDDTNLNNHSCGTQGYAGGTLSCTASCLLDLTQCTVAAQCAEQWSCGDWSACQEGSQTRTCSDANACGTITNQPLTVQSCTVAQTSNGSSNTGGGGNGNSGGGGGGGAGILILPSTPINAETNSIPNETERVTISSDQSGAEGNTNLTDADIRSVIEREQKRFKQLSVALRDRLLGRILLQVKEHGEAWYLEPTTKVRYYLANGPRAYEIMRRFGLGITDADIAKIPVGIESRFQDFDADHDGLPDKMEEGLGTDKANPDTDGDGFKDGEEVLAGYSPLGTGTLVYDANLANQLKGKIILQVERKGQAWYVNPVDGKRYYMKNGEVAYQIMRFLSLGITNVDLDHLRTGE